MLLSGVAALALSGPAAAQTNLLVDAYMPHSHPLVVNLMRPFSADVGRVTNGRVKVNVSTSKMAGSKAQWDAVAKGVTDIALQSTGWKRQLLRLPAVINLPFSVPSSEAASVALWRTHQKFFAPAKEYENKGMKLLGYTTHTGTEFTNSKHALTSIKAFKGMKFRASAGEPTRVVQLLGGTPVVAPGPKIFEYVSKGVVDGVLDGNHAPKAFKFIRYVKHLTKIPGTFGGLAFAYYINKKKWDGISAADRKAIMGVSGEHLSRRIGKGFDVFAGVAVKDMIKAGVKVSAPSPELLATIKKRLEPMEAEYLKRANGRGVDGKAAVNYFRAQSNQLQKQYN